MSAAGGMPPEALARLEAAVRRALDAGDESGLEVIGYGEVSSVVAWDADGRRFACKRLPPFPDGAGVAAYRRVFEEYLAALRARGLRPVDSAIETVAQPDGTVVAWCLQPMLPPLALMPVFVRRCGEGTAVAVFSRIVEQVVACVDGRVGLDGQLSNWALCEDDLVYLDVTTPMIRDAAGAELVDTELFLRSLPWALRGVGRAMLPGILGKYYQPRGVILDLLGNLHKERLTGLLPAFLACANARLSPPLRAGEVARYYARDARDWGLLQRLRRLDRFWQRQVRRRSYPFLLPGTIAR